MNTYFKAMLAAIAFIFFFYLYTIPETNTSTTISSDLRKDVEIKQTQYQSFYDAFNIYRKTKNLPELRWNANLEESAKRKGEMMIKLDCWSHECPEKVSPWFYFDLANYEYFTAGENLAVGFEEDYNAVIAAWEKSETHRKNMDATYFNEMGIYIKCGLDQLNLRKCLYVHHFGSR